MDHTRQRRIHPSAGTERGLYTLGVSIDEPEPGEYRHMKELHIAERSVEFLRRPRLTPNTIPEFLSPNAPKNRLDIIRGLASHNS